jgi:hypothetical protein
MKVCTKGFTKYSIRSQAIIGEKSNIMPPPIEDLFTILLIGARIGSVILYINCIMGLYLSIGNHEMITRASIK